MSKNKPSIDVQIRLPDKPNKVMVDGIDFSHANYLLIEITPDKVTYLVGTMPPKVKLNEKVVPSEPIKPSENQ